MSERSDLEDIDGDTSAGTEGEGRGLGAIREGIGRVFADTDRQTYTEVMAPAPTFESTSAGLTPGYEASFETEAVVVENEDVDTDADVEEARLRVEQTRTNVSQTIDAIQDRLSPANLAQQAKDSVYDATVGRVQGAVSDVEESAKDMGGTIVETIRQNPVPAALAGIGLGWLFMSMRRSNSGGAQYRYRGYQPSTYSGYRPGYDYGYTPAYGDTGYTAGTYGHQSGTSQSGEGSGIGDTVSNVQATAGQAVNQAQNTAQQTVQGVQQTAGQVAGQVQGAAGQAVDQAQQTVSQVGYQAQQAGQQAVSGFQEMLQTNPMAVAAATIALGAAVGLAIPETRKEDELVGEAKQNLMDTVQQRAQDTVQKVEAVAQQTVSAAQDAAQQAANDQGLKP